MLLILSIVVFNYFINAENSKKHQMVIGIILENNSSQNNLGNLPTLDQIVPAVDIAFEKIKQKFIRFRNFELVTVTKTLTKSMSKSLWEIIDLLQNSTRPQVILGPLDDFNIANAVRLSDGRYRVPLLTPGGNALGLRKKQDFQMLTSTLFTFQDLKYVLLAMFDEFKWKPRSYKNVGLYIFDMENDNNLGDFISEVVYKTLQDANFKIAKEIYKQKLTARPPNHKDNLRELSKNSRIIILCAKPEVIRDIMKAAYDLGFHKGDYAFISFDILNKSQSQRPWYSPLNSTQENEILKKAYRSLLIITLTLPESNNFKSFSEEVKQKSKSLGSQDVSRFVVAFHDSVLIYAHALNDCLDKNVSDGDHITEQMKNKSINGISGNVHIDSNGDRNADYSLLDMDPKTETFQVVAIVNGSDKKFSPVANVQIDWVNVNNRPPLDTPKCGFSNTDCNFGFALTLSTILLVILIIAAVVSIVIYRHFKFHIELKAMNWLIMWDCIETTEKRKARYSDNKVKLKQENLNKLIYPECEESELMNKSFAENEFNMENHYLMTNKDVQLFQGGSFRNARRLSNWSENSLETLAGIQFENLRNHQMFSKTGVYKNGIVAIKPIMHTKKIEINKSLLIQVKKVKDLNNDHICRFIGACLEPQHMCILSEYCPKGSLQDVLENDQIKLDWIFKFSLIQDICRGMIYLHSNIGPHGNLKSSNCLIDSRFVVKLTDFGLQKLRGSKDHLLEENPYAFYRNLLWTAPEILRNSNSLVEGTVKGDIYSFAIILQEIIYRNGVFYLGEFETPIEPQEIVERVKQFRQIPFRPYLGKESENHGSEIDSIIKQMWEEFPLQRPEMRNIKVMFRKFNKAGDSGNILDNLLSRMEQYANNLEGLVTQRTEQYLEEKRKAEDLLYLMLPKSVARQLIRNEPVTAESYESVTIYFSDIVGFTSLSAESTPMQVIELLNHLYTTFDSILENYDVYKVETIGDAYVVVSGLPQRNGNLHAREISRMSLAFLKALFTFQIPHRQDRRLHVRIGMHSGPVCAGVVGLKMPRYCLFGDTVNTASRMESNGQAMKIHISRNTLDVLKTFGSFIITERGQIELKGKGFQTTYWLHGEGDDIVDPVLPEASVIY